VALAAVVAVSVASSREDAARTMFGRAPGPVARAARRLVAAGPEGFVFSLPRVPAMHHLVLYVLVRSQQADQTGTPQRHTGPGPRARCQRGGSALQGARQAGASGNRACRETGAGVRSGPLPTAAGTRRRQ
jgi:hypothetical protein